MSNESTPALDTLVYAQQRPEKTPETLLGADPVKSALDATFNSLSEALKGDSEGLAVLTDARHSTDELLTNVAAHPENRDVFQEFMTHVSQDTDVLLTKHEHSDSLTTPGIEKEWATNIKTRATEALAQISSRSESHSQLMDKFHGHSEGESAGHKL